MVQNGASGRYGADGTEQGGGVDFFEQVTVGPCPDRFVHGVSVCGRGEKNHACVGRVNLQITADIETARIGQTDVEQDDIGRVAGQEFASGAGRACFTDDLETGLIFQKRPESEPYEFAVVHQGDSQGRGRGGGGRIRGGAHDMYG